MKTKDELLLEMWRCLLIAVDTWETEEHNIKYFKEQLVKLGILQ